MYRARTIQYAHSDRVRGLVSGGIGAMHQLATVRERCSFQVNCG